ncbi:MAG: hypothetical protein ACTSXD_00170 [Candidatus Heimdallarchaeaceae archaeon]
MTICTDVGLESTIVRIVLKITKNNFLIIVTYMSESQKIGEKTVYKIFIQSI